jgi:acetyl esterase/lipase
MRIASTAALGLLSVLITALALGLLGTFFPDLPYLGLATGFLPPAMSLAIVGAFVAVLGLSIRWWRRRDWFSGALAVVSVVALIGGTVVNVRMIDAVERAGADVDVLDTLDVLAGPTVAPDAEATYTTYEGEPLKVSVYRPAAKRPSSAPVLVYVHGGGWVEGLRDARSTDMRWFADQGWLVVTIDYALSSADRHLWDVTEGQVGCALAWVATHAADYGGDPTRVSLSGDSAGGNLAINTAYRRAGGTLGSSCGGALPNVGAVSVAYPAVDPADFYTNPDFALGEASRAMAGAYTGGSPDAFPERYKAIASTTHVNASAPPTLILLGADDHLVPTGPTYRFADAARTAGIDVELVAVPYSDHVFDARSGSIGQQAYRQLTAAWLRQHGQAP